MLIGDRDIWRWAEAETGDFNEGLYMHDISAKNDALWKPLLDNDSTFLENIIEAGHHVRIARLREIKHKVDGSGFEVVFENFRTLVVNVTGTGDIGQYGRDRGYELVYCYADKMQNGVLSTSVTIYSAMTDVSVIARKFGGGGHAGAAGFSFPRSTTPFPPAASVTWEHSGDTPEK